MSRSHAEQWTIGRLERPDAAVVAAFATLPTTQIADAGAAVGVVGPGIGWIAGGRDFCGVAVTLWTKPGDILFILKSPDLIAPGDVLVIDGGGRLDAALIGDIVGGAIRRNGAVGLVVDGAVRDVAGLDDLGLPTFARGTHPATGSNEGPGALNVTIQCGGVVVGPGDIVRADRSGLVVVPRDRAEEVLRLSRAVAAREAQWLEALAAGSSLPEALGIDARIAASRPESR
jgi:regulator of RNase E activity RraA